MGEFATYIGGRGRGRGGCKLASRPEVFSVYVAYTQVESPDIDILLQRKRTDALSFVHLGFEYEDRFSIPCDMIYYTVRFGDVAPPVRIK